MKNKEKEWRAFPWANSGPLSNGCQRLATFCCHFPNELWGKVNKSGEFLSQFRGEHPEQLGASNKLAKGKGQARSVENAQLGRSG